MISKFTFRALLTALLLISHTCVFSQQKSTMNFLGRQVLLSPLLNADGSVMFQIKAPKAKSLNLELSGSPKTPMVKDAEGVWSITIPALAPDVYPYRFEIDGSTICDPANPAISSGYKMTAGQSLLTVPGKSPAAWDFTNVPHGTISTHFYHSQVINDDRSYLVYTPVGYDAKRSKPYPVLYLLHGLSENETTWMVAGKANFILDNLIATNKVTPMLIVCPLGYGDPQDITKGIGGPFEEFEQALLSEVIPDVETNYNVGKSATYRAITGLSMGGGQSLYIGLNNPDKFAYVGGFNSAVVMYGMNRDRSTVKQPEKLLDADLFKSVFPQLDASVNSQLKTVWIATGDQDGEFNFSMEFKLWLKSNKINFTEHITPGQHTWMVWKRNLVDFSQLIFK